MADPLCLFTLSDESDASSKRSVEFAFRESFLTPGGNRQFFQRRTRRMANPGVVAAQMRPQGGDVGFVRLLQHGFQAATRGPRFGRSFFTIPLLGRRR